MKTLKGIAGAPGIVCGRYIFFEKNNHKTENIDIDTAVNMAVDKVKTLEEKAKKELGEDKAKIFSAYEMLLCDMVLINMIKAEIDGGEEEAAAVTKVTELMAQKLSVKDNEYMKQRADDIRFVGKILIDIMNGISDEFEFPGGDDKYILAAHELTPVDTMLFDKNRLAGLVCEKGGATSHTVILAKSLGIPAVVGVSVPGKECDMEKAYLDGYTGTFIISPDENTDMVYERLVDDENRFLEKLNSIKNTDTYTRDGERINVCINIGKPSDMDGSEKISFDGVGLFRTEFLYSSSKQKPSFEKQVEAYKAVIDKAAPNLVTVRTLDVGGDKQIDYIKVGSEENPFLGNRGIRLCLSNREIFSEQLKAILIAGAGKSVKIMLPMITSVSEINETRKLTEEIRQRLIDENVPCCGDIKLGIMIETPAAAISADIFAKHADFFSIGTNDLVQYIMAADRGNSEVEYVYNPYHPAVIKMLYNVIKSGNDAGIEVSVCGDLAANTEFTELLIGMGLKKLSVPLPMAGRIKYRISNISISKAHLLAERVLAAEDEHEIQKIMREEENR